MSIPEAHAPKTAVTARFTYVVDTGEKPVTGTTDPDGQLRLRKGTFEEHDMPVEDGRADTARFSLEREGFTLVEHETAITDFTDSDAIRDRYYPEMENLVRSLTGAARVIVFDHTLRTGDEDDRQARRLREPVRVVHNDYTEWSGPQRLRDLLPRDEARSWLRHRVAVVQVWRPVQPTIERDPLAICDARSVAPGDLIASERHHPNRVGEIYQLTHNPEHRWYYFPRMQRNEALVFKCYDSMRDGRARFTAHASFDDPTSPADAPPRESIEARTLALFGPIDAFGGV